MATLGDGCENQTCQRLPSQPWKDINHQLDVDGNLARTDPGKDDPGRHTHDIPEVLLADQVTAIGNPLPGLRVVDVAHDRERPCEKL